MESSPVSNSHWAASAVALEMVERLFWDVCLAADGKHDWESPIRATRFEEPLHHKFHVGIGLGLETKSKKDVYGETRVSDPAVSVVPISASANVLRHRKCRRCDNCTGGLCSHHQQLSDQCETKPLTKCHHFQNHETAGDHFHPTPLVLGLGNKVVPKCKCIMLLAVQDLSRNGICDVRGLIISQNERNGLAGHDFDLGDKPFA